MKNASLQFTFLIDFDSSDVINEFVVQLSSNFDELYGMACPEEKKGETSGLRKRKQLVHICKCYAMKKFMFGKSKHK